jgi:NAD(P) transhydrogenase subunit alpha
MIIGVPRETYPGERRVAIVPAVVSQLVKIGAEVLIEKDAGLLAGFADTAYEAQGASIAADRAAVFSKADLLAQVRGLGANPEVGRQDLGLMRAGQVVLGFLDPLGTPEAARGLAERGATAFALELLPRISRAQSMDALSAMATVAGYQAVLRAASTVNKMFPLMMTAAGTITPAKVLIVGAGVAGLQAIATAHRLGGVVQAYDVRPAVKEQVESLGAKFVELELETSGAEAASGYAQAMDEEFYRRQREMMAKVVAECDVVITTAAIPGKKAPVLITGDMVRSMRPGSIVFDLAAEGGGNCELTQPGETIDVDGVIVVGPVNLPSSIPSDASQMYARNITAFLKNLISEGQVAINTEDQIIRDTLLTYKGEVVNARVREALGMPGGAGPAAERSTA